MSHDDLPDAQRVDEVVDDALRLALDVDYQSRMSALEHEVIGAIGSGKRDGLSPDAMAVVDAVLRMTESNGGANIADVLVMKAEGYPFAVTVELRDGTVKVIVIEAKDNSGDRAHPMPGGSI